jgi:hypothetical protein
MRGYLSSLSWNLDKRFVFLLLVVLLSAGCGKYEDGPEFSFRSKLNRLFGYWTMEKWMLNDVEQAAQLKYQHKFGFAKDGTYYYSFVDTTSSTKLDFSGTWEFRQHKEQLVLGLEDPMNGMEYQVWNIRRLTYKELWLETESPGKRVQWHLKAE